MYSRTLTCTCACKCKIWFFGYTVYIHVHVHIQQYVGVVNFIYSTFCIVEAVVAECVVVIKKLLQMHPKENKDLIMQVAKLAGQVEVQ